MHNINYTEVLKAFIRLVAVPVYDLQGEKI